MLFLIFFGSEDKVAPVRDSERLYDELAEKHVPADLYILKGAEYLNTKFQQLHVFKIIEKFLAENEHSYVALGSICSNNYWYN